MVLSFARDICPLFRPVDIKEMMPYFDLSSYDAVRGNAEAIWARVEDGSMPCDVMWPEDRVELFRAWIDDGMAP